MLASQPVLRAGWTGITYVATSSPHTSETKLALFPPVQSSLPTLTGRGRHLRVPLAQRTATIITVVQSKV